MSVFERMHRRIAPGLGSLPPVYAVLAALLLLGTAGVAALGAGNLLAPASLTNMLVRAVTLGIVSVGQTFTILAGSIDLSVAQLISVVAVMSSFLMQGDPARVPLALVLVVLIGLAVGVVNGIIVTRLRVNALIATLGTGLVMQGILSTSFQNFAGSVPDGVQWVAYGTVGPVPFPILLLVAVALLGGFILQGTPFGAHVYAVGGNRDTARLSGIQTDWVLVRVHVITSLSAVLAGLFIVSRLGSGAPWVGQDGVYDLESVATVVVGGTALAGGRGGISGTVAGVLIFSLLDTAFNQVGVGAFAKQVLRGLIIIAVVAAYSFRSRREVG